MLIPSCVAFIALSTGCPTEHVEMMFNECCDDVYWSPCSGTSQFKHNHQYSKSLPWGTAMRSLQKVVAPNRSQLLSSTPAGESQDPHFLIGPRKLNDEKKCRPLKFFWQGCKIQPGISDDNHQKDFCSRPLLVPLRHLLLSHHQRPEHAVVDRGGVIDRIKSDFVW
jgi:hypothetical protein